MLPGHTVTGAAALALLLAGCTLPRSAGPPAQPAGAHRLLAALEAALERRSLEELAVLFTAECRNTCRGFVPHPVAAQGRRVEARWTARIDEGDLLEDLARGLLSYRRVRQARLEPRQWRSYRGVVLVRAQLRLEGEDREGRALVDRGLVDLTLQRGHAGWRINELLMARVSRIVELRPEEADALAEGGAPAKPLPAAPASRSAQELPPKPVTPQQAEPETWARAGEGGGLFPADLLSLLGRRAAGQLGTLLLISEGNCSGCATVCSRLARLVRGRRGCRALSLRLDSDRGVQDGCNLPRVAASRQARAGLARLRSLLPLLVLLDGEGRPLRLFSGGAAGAELEAELDRRCPP